MRVDNTKALVVGSAGALMLGLWWAVHRAPAPVGEHSAASSEAVPVQHLVLLRPAIDRGAATSVAAPSSVAVVEQPTNGRPAVQRPLWVEVLLTNGAATIPYDQLVAQPLSEQALDSLARRYGELPARPFRNRFGIARALAYVGDERVVGLFRETLFNEHQAVRFPQAEPHPVTGLVVLMGHLASRSDTALDFLRLGLEEDCWQSNVTWTIEGASPAGLLVDSTIRALALSGREEAWSLVLETRHSADAAYIKHHSSAMLDAAVWWATIRDHGRAHAATRTFQDDLEQHLRWAKTPEGMGWRRWAARVQGREEP